MKTYIAVFVVLIAVLGGFLLYRNSNQFDIPRGETVPFFEDNGITKESDTTTDPLESVSTGREEGTDGTDVEIFNEDSNIITMQESTRKIFVTDGVKHSIPLNEILSGGPPKDGIPSIDNPEFVSTKEAEEFLNDNSIGLGLLFNGEARFYPYQILVWHEITNDVVGGDPILVTYCPLCATGIVFDRRRVGGEIEEFGVSGKLWQSNLLMYNRTGNEKTESLWSQVLGEAVLGPATGERLKIISADTVKYGDWQKKHTNTKVLSRDTGTARPYGSDPYGDYYTNDSVSFGATFDDDRLHPKAFVLGIEINSRFKAYHEEALPVGTKTDTFEGQTITVEKSEIGEVRMFIGADKKPLAYIGGFWFSWLAVHPSTELFK